jgi:sugar phosphate permease
MSTGKTQLRRWQAAILLLMVVGYAGCYLCRSNFSVTLNLIAATLVEQGYEPHDARLALGWVASLGTLTYALGKFVTGSLADLFGGRRNILAGMLGSVLFTLWFAVGGGLPLFTLAWVGNRAAQSLCWTGMVKIAGKWFSYSAYGTAMGVVSLSYLFGDAAARWFMGLLMQPGWLTETGLGWRSVFTAAAVGLLLFLGFDLLWLKESPRDIGQEEPAPNPTNVYTSSDDGAQQHAGFRELLVPLLTSPQFVTVCLLSLGLTFLREAFGIWTPTYFAQTIGSSNAEAAHQSALFPLLGGSSVLVAGWLGDWLGRGGRAAVIFGGSLLAAAVLWLLGSRDIVEHSLNPVWLTGLIGFLVLGPYSYLAGAISLDLGGKRGAATACGIIDGVGYLGAMLAGSSVAMLSNEYGWSGAFRAFALVALLTSFVAAVFFHLQRRVDAA